MTSHIARSTVSQNANRYDTQIRTHFPFVPLPFKSEYCTIEICKVSLTRMEWLHLIFCRRESHTADFYFLRLLRSSGSFVSFLRSLLFLAVAFSFLRSSSLSCHHLLFLAVVISFLPLSSLSCSHLLFLAVVDVFVAVINVLQSSMSCSRLFFLAVIDVCVAVIDVCVVVVNVLQSSMSCSCRCVAVVSFLRSSMCCGHRYLSCSH